MHPLECRGERLFLMGDRALYWERVRTLFVADVHLGKTATFRQLGVPAPEATTTRDLARLDALIERTGASRLVVLGDLVHGPAWRTEPTRSLVSAWCARTAEGVEIVLTPGNHERRARFAHGALPVRIAEPGESDGPFTLAHEPTESRHAYALCGHVHPVAVLHDVAGGSMRGPCFWFGAGCAVLPAFGSFTGGKKISPRGGDRVFLVAPGGEIIEVPAQSRERV